MTVANLDAMAELLKALAHVTRLTLLSSLVDGELAVGELEAISGIGQPALSQQLAVLRNAALVETRREAKQVFYRINHDRLGEVSALIDGFAGTVSVPREHAAELAALCGGGVAMFARIA
jgi:DNA-binding transcriptional ArsR family regulator